MDTDLRCHSLVHGVLLVDVASAGVGSEVLCNAVEHDSHLLEEALLNAAQSSGYTVVHRSDGSSNRTTFATPTGELGTGFSSDSQVAPHAGPTDPYGSRIYTAEAAPHGDFVFPATKSGQRSVYSWPIAGFRWSPQPGPKSENSLLATWWQKHERGSAPLA
ncbi:hypothetical protein [Arthrobacter polaris]|uniref:hypothetical protein n=1 Tax=Arthrobacter polaris TaxID=2813727 RepID=UPI001F2E12DC|nr:hypothetical protein [Arthrobacter polaris]UIK89458.1 hypothetical protein J0916_03125 [Arthrobacter polaris]